MDQKLTEAIIKGRMLEYLVEWYNTTIEEQQKWKEKYIKTNIVSLSNSSQKEKGKSVEQEMKEILQQIDIYNKKLEQYIESTKKLIDILEKFNPN